MKKLIYASTLFLLVFSACKKVDSPMPDGIAGANDPVPSLDTICAFTTVDLDAVTSGKNPVPNSLAGSITVSNDQTNLYVKYQTLAGWKLSATSLYVGNCANIPVTVNGNPDVSQFPAQGVHNPMVTSFTYTFSLSSLDTCFCVAATAQVAIFDTNGTQLQSGTAWAVGTPFPGGGAYFQYCPAVCDSCDLRGRTQTQGGWGSNPSGNNPGSYLHANFAGAFPNGLTVGCTTGNTITFTTAQAITDFLPSGGKPAALTATYTNPPSLSNTLAGQVIALSLSVGFDGYDPNFSQTSLSLGSLVIASGTFQGWTVNQLLAEANKALGGCGSSYSFAQLSDGLALINQNFVDGNTNNGALTCP